MKKSCAPAFLAVLLVAVGCAGPAVRVTPEGSLNVPDKGGMPVLEVNIGFEEFSWAGRPGFGGMSQPNPAETFARMAAAAAQETDGISVPDPAEVAERIREEGLDYTLQPDEGQRDEYLSLLNPPAYLTADITRWQENFWPAFLHEATMEFTLTCRRPGRQEPLWTATVKEEADYVKPRELALQALKKVFSEVRSRQEKPGK